MLTALQQLLAVIANAVTRTTELVSLPDGRVAAIIAIAAVTALATVVWAVTGRLVPRAVPIAASIAAAAILGVALLPAPWGVMAGWFVIAAAGIVALILTKRAVLSVRPSLRVVLASAFGVSLLFGWLEGAAGWGSNQPTWQVASIVTVVLLLVARLAIVDATARAGLLATSIAVAALGIGALALDLGDWVDVAHFLTAFGVVVLAAAALPLGKVLTTHDRHAAFWTALPIAVFSALAGWVSLTVFVANDGLFAEPGVSLMLAVLLTGSLLLWAALPSTRAFPVERMAAGVLVAPSVGWITDSFTRLVLDESFLAGVAPVASMLLVSAGALLVSLFRSAKRLPLEIGAAFMGAVAVLASTSVRSDSTWLVLVLASVATLLIANSKDGLFTSTSIRKHLGWVALGLATLGLWWRLKDDAVTDLEPYVLPLAGALLIVGVLAWRATRTPADGDSPAEQPSRAAAGLLLGGLLTGILPLAAVGTNGEILRPIVVVSVSAALLLIGSFLRAPAPTRWFLDAIALAGGVGLIVGAFGRALGMTTRGELADPMLDAWVLVGAVVLVAAAFGQALPRTDDDAGFRRIGSQALGIVGMAGMLVVEGVALRDERLGDLRAILLVVLFAAHPSARSRCRSRSVHPPGRLGRDRLRRDRCLHWARVRPPRPRRIRVGATCARAHRRRCDHDGAQARGAQLAESRTGHRRAPAAVDRCDVQRGRPVETGRRGYRRGGNRAHRCAAAPAGAAHPRHGVRAGARHPHVLTADPGALRVHSVVDLADHRRSDHRGRRDQDRAQHPGSEVVRRCGSAACGNPPGAAA